jgi:rhodanese-related sulfurtransferase
MWIALATASFLLAACGARGTLSLEEAGHAVVTEGGTYTDISVEELHNLPGDKDFVLINTHIPFEGDISGTDLSIPYDEIDQHLNELPGDKGTAIVLYCRSDRMSTIASETLVGLGYTNVFNVDGGMVAWEQAGYRIER